MLASASHDGTVRLWTTPEPRPVLECEEADPEDTFRDPRRQETMTSEATAAHSSSGRGTPTPCTDEPQSMETYISPPDEAGATSSAQYQRVDSPIDGDFDTSQPLRPNHFRQAQ